MMHNCDVTLKEHIQYSVLTTYAFSWSRWGFAIQIWWTCFRLNFKRQPNTTKKIEYIVFSL